MSEPVVIAPYDPAWPRRFELEVRRLRDACGDLIETVEHIGSTAVPGLAAKPIIDLMIGVRSLAGADACVAPLVTWSYEYIAKHEAVMPERRFFIRWDGVERVAHLHMVVTGGAFWRRHLVFRDALRANPAAVRAYAELKRALAVEHAFDRDAYSDAKSEFINDIVRQAGEGYR